MQSQIRKIGNSLGTIIPTAIIQKFELTVGTPLDIVEIDGQIIIKPIAQKKSKFPFSEAELLAGLNADNAHSDLVAQPTNKEWGE